MKNLQFILHISYTNKNENFPFNNMYIYTIFIVNKKNNDTEQTYCDLSFQKKMYGF